jgi:hypothetical protein
VKEKLSQVFDNNPPGSRIEDDQNTDFGTVYKRILINAKVKPGKRGQEIEMTGRSVLTLKC